MPVFLILFLLFIVIPLSELAVLGAVMDDIGLGATIGLCLLTAFVGAGLARMEGLQTLLRIRQQMDAGQLPTQEVLEGFALFLAGAMLFVPGFITDAIGFAILAPPLRKPVAKWFAARIVVMRPMRGPGGRQGPGGGHVYDAEFTEQTDGRRPGELPDDHDESSDGRR